jgi:Putative Flp pilus-assembly TadE/G-like
VKRRRWYLNKVWHNRASDERGEAMVVWCLGLAILLLPLGGLSVDLWHGIAVQRQLQSAADDAADAGASGIDTGSYRQTGCLVLAPGLAEAMASENLALQVGLGPLRDETIAVSPNGQEITVVLTESVHLTLMALVEGGKTLTVTATATSRPEGSQPGAPC